MVGDIISECWATSSRNGGRHHSGMVGGFTRNPHTADLQFKPFRANVETMAGFGIPEEQIAAVVGIDARTPRTIRSLR